MTGGGAMLSASHVSMSASHRALHAAAVRHATHKKSEQLSNGRPIALPIIPKSPPVCRFHASQPCRDIEFFIGNLLVRIHFIIVMIRWTGLAPWEFEFPFPGSLPSTFLAAPARQLSLLWPVALSEVCVQECYRECRSLKLLKHSRSC